jgi:hypothetical protein
VYGKKKCAEVVYGEGGPGPGDGMEDISTGRARCRIRRGESVE